MVNRIFFSLLLVAFLIFSVRHYITPPKIQSFSLKEIYEKNQTGTSENEFLPKGINQQDVRTNPGILFLEGYGKAEISEKNSDKVNIEVDSFVDSKVQLPVINFPVWEIYLDGEKLPMVKTPLLEISIPPGNHKLRLFFKNSKTRKIADGISLISSILILGTLVTKIGGVKIWEEWKKVTHKIGLFQSKAALTIFYFTFFAPLAVLVKFFSDPLGLRIKKRSYWVDKNLENIGSLEKMGKQY